VAALTWLPTTSVAVPRGSLLSSDTIDATRVRADLRIGGEPVHIQARIYHD
jgi:hypothetical protein